jgi:hypothetical protein
MPGHPVSTPSPTTHVHPTRNPTNHATLSQPRLSSLRLPRSDIPRRTGLAPTRRPKPNACHIRPTTLSLPIPVPTTQPVPGRLTHRVPPLPSTPRDYPGPATPRHPVTTFQVIPIPTNPAYIHRLHLRPRLPTPCPTIPCPDYPSPSTPTTTSRTHPGRPALDYPRRGRSCSSPTIRACSPLTCPLHSRLSEPVQPASARRSKPAQTPPSSDYPALSFSFLTRLSAPSHSGPVDPPRPPSSHPHRQSASTHTRLAPTPTTRPESAPSLSDYAARPTPSQLPLTTRRAPSYPPPARQAEQTKIHYPIREKYR